MQQYRHGSAQQSATLLISCPDREGLVAAVTQFIAGNDGNILHLDQHVDQQENVFFMRVEWDLTRFRIPAAEIVTAFAPIAERYQMNWAVRLSENVPRMAVFVSKEAHCLYEILSRYTAGEWRVEIPLIVSNHPTLGDVAARQHRDHVGLLRHVAHPSTVVSPGRLHSPLPRG